MMDIKYILSWGLIIGCWKVLAPLIKFEQVKPEPYETLKDKTKTIYYFMVPIVNKKKAQSEINDDWNNYLFLTKLLLTAREMFAFIGQNSFISNFIYNNYILKEKVKQYTYNSFPYDTIPLW